MTVLCIWNKMEGEPTPKDGEMMIFSKSKFPLILNLKFYLHFKIGNTLTPQIYLWIKSSHTELLDETIGFVILVGITKFPSIKVVFIYTPTNNQREKTVFPHLLTQNVFVFTNLKNNKWNLTVFQNVLFLCFFSYVEETLLFSFLLTISSFILPIFICS